MASLAPLLVALPLLVAAVLMGVARVAPRWLLDGAAIATAVAVGVLGAATAVAVASAPSVVWLGGWHPAGSAVPGIALVVDTPATALVALTGLLAALALVFSWHYFEAVEALYHVLMLIFLGAMAGFLLAGDLFTLFVCVELIGVAAYALTGYKAEQSSPIQGSLNFAVTNSIGATCMLLGIALLYGRTGQLNMAAVGATLAGGPVDRLVVTACALVITGLLVKAGAVPFHFAHADAHAVAPTPVLVLFSGITIELGVYGVARVWWVVFGGAIVEPRHALAGLLVGAGAVTALATAVMCYVQRHLKRLLAFSSLSHVGVLLIGVGLLTPAGLAGAGIFFVAHATTKAALFLGVGVLLHRFDSVDERELRGRGTTERWLGALFLLAGLALAGMPPFATFVGEHALEDAARESGFGWAAVPVAAASVVTGAAAVRAGLRVFAGWGERERPEDAPPEEQEEPAERETRHSGRRTPWVMVAPVALLVAATLAVGVTPGLSAAAERAAGWFADGAAYRALVLDGRAATLRPAAARGPWDVAGLAEQAGLVALAVVLAVAGLYPRRGWSRLHRGTREAVEQPIAWLRTLHSGHVGEYVAWLTAGASLFTTLVVVFVR